MRSLEIALLISVWAHPAQAQKGNTDYWTVSKRFGGSQSDLDSEESGDGVSMDACHAVCLARSSCAGATYRSDTNKCELYKAGGTLIAESSANVYGYVKQSTDAPLKEATFADGDLDLGELGGILKWSLNNAFADFQTHFLLYISEWDPTSTGRMWGPPRTGLNRLQLCLVGENSTEPQYPSWLIDGNSPGIHDTAEICAFVANEDGNFTYSAHIAPEVIHDQWTHFFIYPIIMGKLWSDPIHVEAVDLTVTIGYLAFADKSKKCGFISGQLEFSALNVPTQEGYDLFLSDNDHFNKGNQLLIRSVFRNEAPPIVFPETSINGTLHGVVGKGLWTHLLVAARSKSAKQTKNYGSIRIRDLGLTSKVVNVIMPDADQFAEKVGGCIQWDIETVHAMCVEEHVVLIENAAGKVVFELPAVPAGYSGVPLALQTPRASISKIVVQSSLTHYGRDTSTWPTKVKELAAPLLTPPEKLADIIGLWPSNKFLDVSLQYNWTSKAWIAYNFAPFENTPITEVAFSQAWASDQSLAATALKGVFAELCLGGVEVLMRTTLMKYYPDLVRDGCGVARKLTKPPMCWTHRHGLLPGGKDFIVECTVKMDIPAPHLCRQCSMLWNGIRNENTKASVYVLERKMCGSYRAVPF